VSFVAGAIPPHDGDTSAELSLTPLDASKLAPLPNNMRFEANAYHVDRALPALGVGRVLGLAAKTRRPRRWNARRVLGVLVLGLRREGLECDREAPWTAGVSAWHTW